MNVNIVENRLTNLEEMIKLISPEPTLEAARKEKEI